MRCHVGFLLAMTCAVHGRSHSRRCLTNNELTGHSRQQKEFENNDTAERIEMSTNSWPSFMVAYKFLDISTY